MSLSFSSFTTNEYMAWIAHGAKTTYFIHIRQQISTSEKVNKYIKEIKFEILLQKNPV